MSDYEKMQNILYALARIHRSRSVALLTIEDALEKCSDPKMIDFYYRRLCKNVR